MEGMLDLNWTAIATVVAIFNCGVNLLLFFYVRITAAHSAKTERIDMLQQDVDSRLDAQAERLTRAEQNIFHAPNHDQMAALHRRMDKFAESLSRLEGQSQSANRTLELLHEYMLSKDRK